MSNRRIEMRNVKEILRLKFEMGLSNRQIGRSCGLPHSTVGDVLRRVSAAGLRWPLAEDVEDAELEAMLFPRRPESGGRPLPDFAKLHVELRRPGVTLQLLWSEYKQMQEEGYQYSRFCELYRAWTKKVDYCLRGEHRAGEKLFVDYAGATMPIVDAETGEVREASIFVAALGASSYTYAEATWTQQLPDWIASHIRALEYLGGVPEILVPDNLRSGVSFACRYEPGLNRTYEECASFYGAAVIPARVRKPRDKAKVENAVLLVERWILAALRNHTFFSLAELNAKIRELLERLNHRPFKRVNATRAELFERLDKPALRPLPVGRYGYAEWHKVRVGRDYHILLDEHAYSVPYQLVGKEVEVRSTSSTVEVLHRGNRVASHARSHAEGKATTLPEHRPKSHREYLEWTPTRLLSWAQGIGPHTHRVADHLLTSKPHPEQGFRSCLGLRKLAKQFTSARLEKACRRGLAIGSPTYTSLRSILKNGLEGQPLPSRQARTPSPPVPNHHNIRGSGYYQGKEHDTYVIRTDNGETLCHETEWHGPGNGRATPTSGCRRTRF